MAIIRQVLNNGETGKWAFCEYSDENPAATLRVIGDEYDDEEGANGWRDEYLKTEKEAEGELKEAQNPLFSFGRAIELLKAGKRVARIGWNGKGMWLELIQAKDYHINNHNFGPKNEHDHNWRERVPKMLPWIGMKTADNSFVPWLASQTDVLSDDWTCLDEVAVGDALKAGRTEGILQEGNEPTHSFQTADKEENLTALEEANAIGYLQNLDHSEDTDDQPTNKPGSWMKDALETNKVLGDEMLKQTPAPQQLAAVAEKIRVIVVRVLGVEVHEVMMKSKMGNDLGADDLDMVEIVMEIEKEFDIRIPDADVDNTRNFTFEDVVNITKKYLP